jgi:hypothetical protein
MYFYIHWDMDFWVVDFMNFAYTTWFLSHCYYDRNYCLIHITFDIIVDMPLITEVVFWNQLK